ncbi:hypothetical protein L6V77_24565, partial [Myxococcota bacterium]|nr:hypothetical protein [Myxococcota bacterium]
DAALPPDPDAAPPSPDAAPPEPDAAGPCADPRLGTPCVLPGVCGEGVYVCVADDMEPVRCSTAPGEVDSPAAPEICNGLDDDCDGAVDGPATDALDACTEGLGVCAADGVLRCVDGQQTCDARPGVPGEERCNLLDDDCDGEVDGPDADGGDACVLGLGVCAADGVQRCVDGQQTCDARPGAAAPEVCNDLDDDCDGALDEDAGCLCVAEETAPCYDGPIGTEGLGLCLGGERTCRADRQGFGACEGQVLPEPEACNTLDDDCDGDVDEGFDFESDPANCGACGIVCGGRGALEECLAGECVLVRCEDGRYDQDLDPATGCERSYEPRLVYVGEGGDAEPDGSPADPFPTVVAALASTGEAPGTTVVMLPGQYPTGDLSIAAERITLMADTPGTVTWPIVAGVAGVQLRGDHSRVRGIVFTAENSARAVQLVGAGMEASGVVVGNVNTTSAVNPPRGGVGLSATGPAARLSDISIGNVRGMAGRQASDATRNGQSATGLFVDGSAPLILRVTVADTTGGAGGVNPSADTIHGPGGSAVAVGIRNAVDALIHGVLVDGVTAGNGCCVTFDGEKNGGSGGPAFGLTLTDAPGARVRASTVTRIQAGRAGASGANGSYAYAGNSGGRAEAITLTRADGAMLDALTVLTVAGGAGGGTVRASAYARNAAGGTGGGAVGVNVVTSLDVTLTALGVDGLRPGDGGTPGGGVPGVAFGATIDATSRGAAFDAASRVHGEAFHYYDGERGVVIADEVLDAPVWPTNWGRITLRNVSGAEVRGTRVLGLTGGGARIRGAGGDPGIPPPTVGLYIDAETTGVAVRGSEFTNLVGGPAGPYSDPAEAMTERGGTVHAIFAEAHAADTLVLSGNVFGLLTAGRALPGAREAQGHVVAVDAARAVTADHNLFHTLTGREVWGYAFRAPGRNATFTHETHADYSGATQETAVRVFNAEGGMNAAVTHGIVAGVQELLRGDVAGQAARLSHSYVLMFDTLDPGVVNAAAGVNVLRADPLFSFNPVEYGLAAGSPAVDAGDPESDCDLEPPDPDGVCRADLGHLGNTPAGRGVAGR